MAVIIEMNEAQAKIMLQALEEWFRLRMGQDFNLANGLAFLGYKHDKDHPERFDAAIQRRDSIQAVMRAMFNIAWPHYGSPQVVEPEVHIASDIWSQLRWELSTKDSWQSPPFQMGPEPMPKITVERSGAECCPDQNAGEEENNGKA